MFDKVGEIHIGSVRKKSGKLHKKQYNERATKALCHLLCLAGYNSHDELKGNSECFRDTMDLITSVKSKLITLTGLTESVANGNNNCKSDNEDKKILNDLSSLFENENENIINNEKNKPQIKKNREHHGFKTRT